MRDVSGSFLRLYMAVARGRLTLSAAALEQLAAQESAVGLAEAAVVQAAKMAHLVLPSLAPLQLVDCFSQFVLDDGGVEVTVTLQGYHRAPLDGAALLAAAAGLTELAVRAQAGTLGDLHVVQSVQRD